MPLVSDVWYGNHIIRPHFFEESLNSEVYTDFLENIFSQLLKNVPLDLRINMWMQHDGTPAHSAKISRLKMQEIFPQKWIGWGGTVHWLDCSTDLTRLLSIEFY